MKSALTSVVDLLECNIFPPQVTQVAYNFHKTSSKDFPITVEEGKSFFAKDKLCVRNKEDEYFEGEKTVEFENLIAGYRDYNKNNKIIIENMNLELYEDERIAIVGNNGAGKSTMLKMISRLVKPTSGDVRINGESIINKSPEEVCNKVSYIQQNPEEMFIDDSIEKDVSYFLRSREIEGFENIVGDILYQLNLYDIRDKDARLLSGGQQRRVSLAIGMGMTPEIILLDEPTASLDINSRRELLKLLDILKKYIKTAIVATHDMQLVADWANRVIVMNEGKIIFDGDTKELFTRKDILNKANLIPPQIVQLSHALDLNDICLSIDNIYRVSDSFRFNDVFKSDKIS